MTNNNMRPERAETVRQERRRRDDTNIDGGQKLKLAIPPEVKARLDREGLTPRWVNDVGNRMEQLTKHDDYDRVEGVEPVSVVIDGPKGTTCKAYLLAKPAEFIVEDREKRDVARRKTEQAMFDKDEIAKDPSRYLAEGSKLARRVEASPPG